MNTTSVFGLGLGLAALGSASAPAAVAPDEAEPRMVELAICLDTSGSMDGLIGAAKQKLWAVVNDLALAEPTPQLRVALITFGNDGHSAENGWVAVATPFTEDLDLVSGKLFELSTNGGTEFVGRALHNANELEWIGSEDSLKLVVVAGNESADQDKEVPYPSMCSALISRGIMINSIYCGPVTDDIAPGWRDVAKRADGHFASIDKDNGTVVIETPFDDQLGQLSASLNTTYLPYGASGTAALENQVTQDNNAASLNKAAAAQRCATKGGALYACGSWDLVDACKSADFKLADIKAEQLPEIMKDMTPEERQAHVEKMGAERAKLQADIKDLTTKRQKYVQDEMKRQSLDESKSFDRVLRDAIRAQAEARGFQFAGNESG